MDEILSSILPPGLADKQEAVIAILVILISMVLLFLWSRTSSGGRGKFVVLTGPCGGGKTRLFYQLVGRQVSDTVASMQGRLQHVCTWSNGMIPIHNRKRYL